MLRSQMNEISKFKFIKLPSINGLYLLLVMSNLLIFQFQWKSLKDLHQEVEECVEILLHLVLERGQILLHSVLEEGRDFTGSIIHLIS